ncbi:MAG: hypothetical protein OXS29_18615 [bacterium]|nr:hypothetical protein [bacterium]MDE0289366.1 hypothetical protein [bacterium]MDE0439438.1 hypothetical protein [bacterium]
MVPDDEIDEDECARLVRKSQGQRHVDVVVFAARSLGLGRTRVQHDERGQGHQAAGEELPAGISARRTGNYLRAPSGVAG